MSGERTSSQTRNLYSESKTRLCERIAANIQSAGSVSRQIIKGSKTGEILGQSAKTFASTENTIENTALNIKRLQISTKQFQMQLEDINKSDRRITELVKPLSRVLLILLEDHNADDNADNDSNDGTEDNEEKLEARHGWGRVWRVVARRRVVDKIN
ncbi:unnamed protein product, partial [Oppiella nova]